MNSDQIIRVDNIVVCIQNILSKVDNDALYYYEIVLAVTLR